MSHAIAYQFDQFGFYQGETEADESPLEPGVYLLPNRCTLLAPPTDIPVGQWPRWNGAGWMLATKPPSPAQADPIAKLRDFLASNPDVAELLS